MVMTRSWPVYLAVILAMLFWGMSFVWTSIVFRYYLPVTTVFIRLVISTVLLFAFVKLTGRWQHIRRGDLMLFLGSAFLNPFLYFIGESYGLKYSSPTISAVIIATIPLFTPMVAYYTLNERLTLLNKLGLVVSFSGILLMLVDRNLTFTVAPLGVLMLMFAVASAIGYSVLLKKLTEKYNAFFIITVQNGLGLMFFLPFFLVFEWDDFIGVRPDIQLISSVLALAVLASSLAFVFFTMGTRELGISRTNVFSNTIPVFTALFSFLLLDEYFDLKKVAGMAIVIAGVMLSQRGAHQIMLGMFGYIAQKLTYKNQRR